MELHILPAAERFIRRMVRFGGGESCGFRLVVTPGGCSGLASECSVEPAPQPDDRVVEIGDLKLFLPGPSAALLEGARIDFAETATQTGLVFQTREAAPCACDAAGAASAAPAFGVVALHTIARRDPAADEA